MVGSTLLRLSVIFQNFISQRNPNASIFYLLRTSLPHTIFLLDYSTSKCFVPSFENISGYLERAHFL